MNLQETTSMALLDPWQKESFLHPFMFASISLVLVLVILLMKKDKRSVKLPPSPPKLPIIGNLHQIGNMPHESFHNLAKKFGPIMFLWLGQVPTVVISSARLAKEALKTFDLALSSRPELFSAKHLHYNCTDLAFSPYGTYWRNIRKICTLQLLSAKRVQSFSFVRKDEVAHLVKRITESYPSTINLTHMLELYANNNICRVAFGKDFSQGGDNVRHNFQKILEEYQMLLGGFSIGDYFPSMEFLHKFTGMESRLKDTFRRFDHICDKILEEHRKKENRKDQKDLVDVLLEIQQDGDLETPLTADNIKAIIINMFVGGTDTNSITLDWTMTELIINPKVMQRAQAEVRSIVGERRFVSENDLSHLGYMKAVVKETFRLHPPAPLLAPRESIQDVTIDSYNIPAKTRFFINAWAIGRDPELWENPEMFEPERFMNSHIDFKGQDFELIPFGAGRRICPAITFTVATVELALAQLLHSFDWELPPGVEAKDLDMTEAFGITTHRTSPLMVVAKPYFSDHLN